MAKPIYPFQPFIEVTIDDNNESFSDRIFIPEELISDGFLPYDVFYESLYELISKVGYPISKDEIMLAYGKSGVVDSSGVTTIITKSESIGAVTIGYFIVGMENAAIPIDIDLESSEMMSEEDVLIDDENQQSEVTVSSYINEIVRLNEYRDKNTSLKSKIVIMILPSSDDDMTESKCEWLHYHTNNYMNRGYKIYVENESQTGRDLIQYILNCEYTNCVVVLDGEPETYVSPLNYQPIGACVHNKPGKPTVRSVMEQFATHALDPSKETVKQTNALVNVQA